VCPYASSQFSILCSHEDDIPYPELMKRMKESSFVWINSNMRNMSLPSDIYLPEYSVVTVNGADGHTRRIALLGLNTEDPALYRKGSFGGATIDPLNAKAVALYGEIFANEVNLDAIIPLTHQSVSQDRQLAASADVEFPLILGGHDHEPYLETIGKCTLVKTGLNAQKFAICDVTWSSPDATSPSVQVTMRQTTDYPPKPEIQSLVEKHHRVLLELEKAVLCPVSDLQSGFLPLSSVSTRLHPSTMGTFLCELIKEALGVECVLLNSGNVRGNHSYESDQARKKL
jgi:2',3'-cyclic-nucleotide 2'-phosphodiesterase (5'-nucleotidase family)